MSWITLTGPLAYAIALLIVPGMPIALAAGRRGFAAAALAPALSLTALGMGAIVGDLAGVPWGWWTPTIASVVLAGVAWGARRLLRRWDLAPDAGASLRSQWPLWTATFLAAVLGLIQLGRVFGRPDAFSQTYDNVFHLSLVRLFAETGTGSSIANGGLYPGTGAWFYPAAFHDVASLVFISFSGGVPVAITATVFAVVAVVWPLAALHLVTRLLPVAPAMATVPALVIGAGVLTASFPGFPMLLVKFGVLYPNMLGFALLPALLALVVEALGLGRSQRYDVLALVLGVLAVPGMFLSHPTALLSLLAVATPLVLVRAVREWRSLRAGEAPRRPTVVRLVLLLGYGPALLVVWTLVRPSEAPWPPPIDHLNAIGQTLLNSPLGTGPAWVPSALMIVGLVALWRRRQRWFVAAWAVASGLFVIAAAGPISGVRDFLTGIYYNDPYRPAALFSAMALVPASIGLDAALRWATGRAKAWMPRPNPRSVEVLVGVLAVAALVGTIQPVPPMTQAVELAARTYALTDSSALLTTDEYALLQRVPGQIPPGVRVATNPWNGSSLLFAFSGRPTTTKHIAMLITPELVLMNEHLRDAAARPDVCSAAAKLEVGYVLDFGPNDVHGGKHPFPGLSNLDTAPGFELVDREGDAALYQLTACR